jgi:hypothetical protein
MRSRFTRLLVPALVALPLAFALTGCEAFGEKETKLQGDRRPLFPEGVPGVQFGAPPPQPTNSNVPIPAAGMQPANPEDRAGSGQAGSGQAGQQPSAQPAPPPAAKSARTKGDSSDAWSGTR